LHAQALAAGERATTGWSPERGRPGTAGSSAFGRSGDELVGIGVRALGIPSLGGYQGQGGTGAANGLPAQYVMRGGFRMPKKGSHAPGASGGADVSVLREHQLGQLPGPGATADWGARPGTAPSPGRTDNANRW
jgi:hypothetical protein